MSLFYSLSAAPLASPGGSRTTCSHVADLRRRLGWDAAPHQRLQRHAPACLATRLMEPLAPAVRLHVSVCLCVSVPVSLSVCVCSSAAVDVLLIYGARDINAVNTCTYRARGDRPQRLREITAATPPNSALTIVTQHFGSRRANQRRGWRSVGPDETRRGAVS